MRSFRNDLQDSHRGEKGPHRFLRVRVAPCALEKRLSGSRLHVCPVCLIRLNAGSADVPAGAGGLHLFTINGRLGVSGVWAHHRRYGWLRSAVGNGQGGGARRGGAQLNPPESDEQVKRSSNATQTYTQFPLIKNFPKVSKQSHRNFSCWKCPSTDKD